MAGWHGVFRQASPLGLCGGSSGGCSSSRSSSGFSQQGLYWGRPATPTALAGSLLHVRGCSTEQLSRRRVFKRECFNDTIMPNTTELLYGQYGIRALQGSRIAANTLEAVRRTLRRRIQKSARLWTRIRATVPVTQKALGVRMGKGKGLISYYCTPVRPGQIIFELDRVPRLVALQALQAVQHKFPVRLGFVEWS